MFVCAITECLCNHRSSVCAITECMCNHRVFVQSHIKCLFVQSQIKIAMLDSAHDSVAALKAELEVKGVSSDCCFFRLLFLQAASGCLLQAAISSGCFRLSASGYCFFRLLFLQTASGCLLQAAVSSGCFRVSASCCCFFRLVVSVSVTLL